MTITTNPPRSRAPRRVSVLFASLENYSSFWFPTRKGAFVKTSFCTAQAFDKWFFVNPFRSVLVKQTKLSKELMKALCAPSPFIDLVEPKPFPAGAGETIRPSLLGQTGSVGPVGTPGCCGGPCPCDRPRGDEPHNDNNITGPTC
jgi:hypothetical protein